MTKIKDIMSFFEEFAPLDTAMDFDNSGLLVGSADTEISDVLLALDITPEVVLEAERLGCQLIISHHPVIFHPIKRIDTTSVPYMLAARNISALCMHTNLDLSVDFGVNLCLAEAIGAKNTRLCEVGECLFLGELEEELSMEKFAENVKISLGCNGLRYSDCGKKVKKIAVSSGAGGSNVYDAKSVGADVLVTGEIRHHEINDAFFMGLAVVDAGHFKTEDIVISPLCRKLSAKFNDINFTKSALCDDKMKYLS